MSIKLTCGDGVVLRLHREHFEKSVFNNPDIAAARSYTLRCKARSEIVNAVLDMADGEAETATITEDNCEELKSLCKELGFPGLDEELRAFRGETGSDSVDLKEFLQLKERVTRQDKRLTELERQLNEVLSWKRKAESVSREFQSLERKVEEVARVCEERDVEASRNTERALGECAKQRDLEELAGDVAELKGNEKKTAMKFSPTKTETPTTPPRPTPPALGKRREFVYNSSEPLEGIIAYLTRECGGIGLSVSGAYYHQRRAAGDKEYVCFGADSDMCYDFRDRRVIPTSYSIKSHENDSRFLAPFESWVIEASTSKDWSDKSSWTEIDRRDRDGSLRLCATANFKISNVPSEGFRCIRIRQTAHYPYGIRAAFSSLEIFGTLFEK